MEKSKWVVGNSNEGMWFVVCERCASESDAPEKHEDVFGELNAEDDDSHPKCESCDSRF